MQHYDEMSSQPSNTTECRDVWSGGLYDRLESQLYEIWVRKALSSKSDGASILTAALRPQREPITSSYCIEILLSNQTLNQGLNLVI